MQEGLPFLTNNYGAARAEIKEVASALKKISFAILKSIEWILDAVFVPHPGQKYIEESRYKAMRMLGHM